MDVIAFSKVSTEVVQDSSQIEAYAHAFCSEYMSAKSGARSSNFGASYKVLSLSFGKASVSEEEVASKYCDATSANSAKADAYRQYVETIAPGAYSAYVRCEELRGSGVDISVDKNSVLPRYFAVAVSFKTSDALASQLMSYAASPGVTCKWKHGKGATSTVGANRFDVLECNRENSAVKSAVQVFPTTKPNSQLSFAWDKYEGGLPVDTLKQLTQQVATATAALNQATQSLRSSVLAFALAACPDGWVEYKPAYGRFVRGIDKSDPKIDPDGTRTPGALLYRLGLSGHGFAAQAAARMA